jgi:MFS family permease
MKLRSKLREDSNRIVLAQGLRAFAYGYTAILLGHLLADRKVSNLRVGALLTAITLGSSISSLLITRLVRKIGRRNSYRLFYAMMAIGGLLIAVHPSPWTLIPIALTGVLSTDTNDNGPATILEQVMFAEHVERHGLMQLLGRYNAVAALCGALGALTQGWLARFPLFNSTFIGYLALTATGLIALWATSGISPQVEKKEDQNHRKLKDSPARNKILQLAALFSIDSAAGGLTTATWLAFYLTHRYHMSPISLGYLFFTFALLQAISMFFAPYVAGQIGLVNTMVLTHLLSNLFLIIAAFCGDLKIAILLLLLRAALSQMDIPTRQALVLTVVPEPDRMSASVATSTSRYLVRPASPTVAGFLSHVAFAAPLVVAGVMKLGYDLAILLWAKKGGYLKTGSRSAEKYS